MKFVKGCWHAALAVLGETGVRSVFGLPGDDLDALDAAAESAIDFILCRDQRNAVFMATGYAIASGQIGVALVGKGPAVTNTATGLLEASRSAAPVLLLAGGTAVERLGSGAFQEFNQLEVVRPLVKWAARVDHPDRLVPMLRRALLVAGAGAPGPVYLELPDHLLAQEIPVPIRVADTPERPSSVTVDQDSPALRALTAAKRPIVLVGGGMRHRNAGRRVERVASAFGAMVACTASGRGAVDESLPAFCGLAGLYTPEAVASLWADTDCVIALGSRLEETATFGWPEQIGRDIPVVQVNVDAAEFATSFDGPLVLADAGALLDAWLAHTPSQPANPDWTARVRAAHNGLQDAHRAHLRVLAGAPGLHIAEVLAALDEVLPPNRILVQENGLQDMWSYLFPFYTCADGAGSVVPSEQTSLGFGAAAAIGVKQVQLDRPVVAFVGDGAFDMFSADLPTAVTQGGLLFVVLRNGGYGWLQSQLQKRERQLSGFAFVDAAATGSSAPEVPGLQQISVIDKTAVSSTVAEAWALCQAGHVVVLNIPVRLEDALFAASEAGGDFPVL